MNQILAIALALSLLVGGGYSFKLQRDLVRQRMELMLVTAERDSLQWELTTAKERLAQSQRAQDAATDALKRAQAASRELASVKDWIRGNEDAPVPAWFNDLLVRIGFGLPGVETGSPNPN